MCTTSTSVHTRHFVSYMLASSTTICQLSVLPIRASRRYYHLWTPPPTAILLRRASVFISAKNYTAHRLATYQNSAHFALKPCQSGHCLRVWRRIGELGHGLPGPLSKTGLHRQGRDKGPHGVWPDLRFGFVWFKHICPRRGGPTGPREPHSPKGLGPCMNAADRTIFRPKIIAHDTGLHLIGRKCTDSN